MNAPNTTFAHLPSTIKLGDLEVCRLGFGAMSLPGKFVWGDPDDPEKARAVVRRAIDLGINLIDSSWYYGPYVSHRLIAEAIYPYPSDVVIACKLGGKRLPDKSWASALTPTELRKGCEDDLKWLRLDRIDVVHLRYMGGSPVPFKESLDTLIDLQKEGKIRHIGLSNVSLEQVEEALKSTPIVSVQNMYNIEGGRGALAKQRHAEVNDPQAVLNLCAEKGIAFMPFFPLGSGTLLGRGSALHNFAVEKGISPAQAGIAWLLAHSPVMLPIPGTSSVAHLEENWEARTVHLSKEDMAAIEKAGV